MVGVSKAILPVRASDPAMPCLCHLNVMWIIRLTMLRRIWLPSVFGDVATFKAVVSVCDYTWCISDNYLLHFVNVMLLYYLSLFVCNNDVIFNENFNFKN